MATTKFKLNWLAKHKNKYRSKVNKAFLAVKYDIIDFLNSIEGEPDYFLKYLAVCVDTNDAASFIKILQGIIEESKQCIGDPMATKARVFCNYALFRIYLLSNFTIQWTDITIKCKHCRRLVKTNYLFSDKLCPYCGHIIL